MKYWTMGALGAATLLSGCIPEEIPEDELPRYTAQVMCDQERRCNRGAWQDAYYGQGDCRATWERVMTELVDFFDELDCDYDKREAGKAIAKIADMDCEDWYEDVFEDGGADLLDEVWEQCGTFTTYTLPPTYYGSGS